jgi:hypothetical protein
VARVLERILADPRVRLFGNVTFRVDLHHRDLKRHYDQIVYAVGAQADRRMSIPGEDLPNSHPAISFVGWYNGHPDYRELPVDLACERAVVVGNGNVAMDVARIPATAPDELATTDIADHALEALRASRTVIEEDRTARAYLKILREYAARDRHGAQRRIVLRRRASTTPPTKAGGSWTATSWPSGRQPGTAPGQGLQRPGDAGGHPPRGLDRGPFM